MSLAQIIACRSVTGRNLHDAAKRRADLALSTFVPESRFAARLHRREDAD
jgi:hypothetical protein